MESIFKNIFKGKAVIVGIGNTMRGDDGFGPILIERLSRSLYSGAGLKRRAKLVCIDAGSAPENYIGKIVKEKPDTVLIVDAVHLGSAPGEYKLLTKPDIVNCGLTTHNISPNILIDFLEKETSADIYLLGVQPENLSFGNEISHSVKKTLIDLSEMLKEIINA